MGIFILRFSNDILFVRLKYAIKLLMPQIGTIGRKLIIMRNTIICLLFCTISINCDAQTDTLRFETFNSILIKRNHKIINSNTQKRNFRQIFLSSVNINKIYSPWNLISDNETFFWGLSKKDIESLFGKPNEEIPLHKVY